MLYNDPIAEYLDRLSRALAFDRPLARRVRQEIADQLYESVFVETAGGMPRAHAERYAVERFGDPCEIAAGYRALSLHERMRKTGAIVPVVIGGIFLAMKARVAWYAAQNWVAGETLSALNKFALPIDRIAFIAAAVLAVLSWLYTVTRSTPAGDSADSRQQLRCGQILAGAATFALGIAVMTECLLTGCRLAEAAMPAIVLPAVSIILEVALVCAAAIYIRNTHRRFAYSPIGR